MSPSAAVLVTSIVVDSTIVSIGLGRQHGALFTYSDGDGEIIGALNGGTLLSETHRGYGFTEGPLSFIRVQ